MEGDIDFFTLCGYSQEQRKELRKIAMEMSTALAKSIDEVNLIINNALASADLAVERLKEYAKRFKDFIDTKSKELVHEKQEFKPVRKIMLQNLIFNKRKRCCIRNSC